MVASAVSDGYASSRYPDPDPAGRRSDVGPQLRVGLGSWRHRRRSPHCRDCAVADGQAVTRFGIYVHLESFLIGMAFGALVIAAVIAAITIWAEARK